MTNSHPATEAHPSADLRSDLRQRRRRGGRLRRGAVSSGELVDHLLDRIARHNPTVNAIVTLDAEGARERAAQADRALERGQIWGPLHGVPMTIKDTFETAGAAHHRGSAVPRAARAGARRGRGRSRPAAPAR